MMFIFFLRKRLFNMINDLPTVFEVVTGAAKKQQKAKSSVSNHSSNKSKSNSKSRTSENQVKVSKPQLKEDDEYGEMLCGACGENYASDEFWICCDICEKWFHGQCVMITPTIAEHIKQYKCPLCSKKRARPSCSKKRARPVFCKKLLRTSENQVKVSKPQLRYEEEDDEYGEMLCGACSENYASDEFWICCDICDKWFHGKCVKMTPARADHIKQYKCPSCSKKIARQGFRFGFGRR